MQELAYIHNLLYVCVSAGCQGQMAVAWGGGKRENEREGAVISLHAVNFCYRSSDRLFSTLLCNW